MSVEQQLHEHYLDNAADVVGGPDLANVLARGRRLRRTRLAAVIGTAAAVTVGAVVTASLAGNGAPTTASDPNRDADPAAESEGYVAGTDIDETMQQVVAGHLPVLGPPEDVYPSDWFTNGPIPDAEFAQATDWQAAYPVDDGEHVLVVMGYPDPEEPAGCPGCTKESVPDGALMTHVSHLQGSGEWLFLTSLVRDDGFTVNLIDYVTAAHLAAAREARSISNADAATVVRDPRLQFAAP